MSKVLFLHVGNVKSCDKEQFARDSIKISLILKGILMVVDTVCLPVNVQ